MRVIEARRNFAIFHCQDRLEQPGNTHSGSAHQVADIRLHRTHAQWAGPAPREQLAERRRLDWVAQLGARTMQLHVIDMRTVEACASVCPAQNVSLSSNRRRGQSSSIPAGMTHNAATNYGADPISISYRRIERLQQNQAGSLTPHVPVGAFIECIRVARSRQGTELRLEKRGFGGQAEIGCHPRLPAMTRHSAGSRTQDAPLPARKTDRNRR